MSAVRTKIAFIIPTTSNKRDWERAKDSLLFSSIQSFYKTKSNGYKYKFFIGHDYDDPFYTDKVKMIISDEFSSPYVDIEFFDLRVEKGHVTKMWNILADKALEWGAEYLYQCGDDISYSQTGWLEECVNTLSSHGNVGLTGPKNINGNTRILTQCFVHRTHVEKLGYFFPEEIRNWYCDDWINGIYRNIGCHYAIPDKYYCANLGGAERYNIVRCSELCQQLVARDFTKLTSA
jgi:hypothetical protein